MQRSLLALMVILAMLYRCGQEASKKPTLAELAPKPPAAITSLQNEAQKRLEMACEHWESKVMGPPPNFCIPGGLSPAFCHSASGASFCK
jgi:hypothetical protein